MDEPTNTGLPDWMEFGATIASSLGLGALIPGIVQRIWPTAEQSVETETSLSQAAFGVLEKQRESHDALQVEWQRLYETERGLREEQLAEVREENARLLERLEQLERIASDDGSG